MVRVQSSPPPSRQRPAPRHFPGWLSLRRAGAVLAALAMLAGGAAGQESPPRDIGVELRGQVSDPLVERFYSARGWRAAWTEDQARSLEQAIEDAPRHGLEPRRFLDLIVPSEDPVRRDAALTRAALAYAEALAHGAVDPEELHDIFELESARIDVVAGLSQALERGELGNWLATLPPQDAECDALSRAYLAARRSSEVSTEIGAEALIRPGDAAA